MAVSGKKFIVMCSTAIGIIYATGYSVTQPVTAQEESNIQNSWTASPEPSVRSGPTVAPSPTPSTDSSKIIPPGARFHNRHQAEQPFAASTPNVSESPSAAPKSASAADSNQGSSTLQTKYKDGTYNGSGTNRFGTVEVSVTIKSGKISAVEITNCATRYPEWVIDSLPTEVIAKQSPEVDTVSGATRSSEDFINAVNDALSQAEQA
ncbi:FMN-binding protein [Gorillibacterium massiliense]|uniref:FMN-binding protein n=1 Tax=Gorillibacterium massiliense TaxID=1280390 RepID=UPI0004BA5608|nr:FMN-binding protein [Gorillibacterium massiliense]